MADKVFIGREVELSRIQEVLDSYLRERRGTLVDILGEGGVGKSVLLSRALEVPLAESCLLVGPIDLAETSNQDPLSIANRITKGLGRENFPKYHKQLHEYACAELDKKLQMQEQAQRAFVEELVSLSKIQRLVVAFDTVEAVRGKRVFDWLSDEFVSTVVGTVLVMVAGREALITDVPRLDLKLERFSSPEVHVLAQEMFRLRGEHFDLDPLETAMIGKKSGGRPILASLAVDFLLETGDLDRLLSFETDFGKEIALFFRDNPDRPEESAVVVHMAILDRRFNRQIYQSIETVDDDRAAQVLQNMRPLSFVKYLDQSDSYSLHDEMLELLNKFGDIPPAYSADVRKRATEAYYVPLLETHIDAYRRQNLVLDMLHYMQSYSPTDAFEFFQEDFSEAFGEYELHYCRRLIETMRETAWDPPQSHALDLLEGELLLQLYAPFAARELFERVCSSDFMVDSSELMAQALEGLGKCTIIGCETAGENVAAALDHLDRALSLAIESGDQARIASVRLNIGLTQQMLGNHGAAIDNYTHAVDRAIEAEGFRLAAEVSDRLVFLLRRIGRVQSALEWGLKGLKWREELKDQLELARSYHNLGAVYRDLKNKDASVENLKKAISIYSEMNAHADAAQALKDLGWTYFRFNDNENAKYFAEKSVSICDRYGFGRIKGEALHTVFEVIDSEIGETASGPILQEGLELSKKHGGIFMALDLLSHQVIIDRRTGNCDKIPGRIQDMEEYIEKGCEYRYFLGRALNIWGDCAFDDGDYDTAFERYHRGYQELAIGGESGAYIAPYRTQVDNHLPKVLESLDSENREKYCRLFCDSWAESGLAESYPEVVEVCHSYLKS